MNSGKAVEEASSKRSGRDYFVNSAEILEGAVLEVTEEMEAKDAADAEELGAADGGDELWFQS